jgi:hypothetical protein
VNQQSDGNGVVSRAERARWVKRYRASGLGLKLFAAEHGLRPGQLHYWAYAPGPAAATAPGAPVFQEVRLAGSLTPVSGWAAEIVVASGATLRLRAGTAPEWVGALVQALGGPCSP